METQIRFAEGAPSAQEKSCPANDHRTAQITPQGLEPQPTESESAVLPITPWGSGGYVNLIGQFYQRIPLV